jgi:hypothetical protein
MTAVILSSQHSITQEYKNGKNSPSVTSLQQPLLLFMEFTLNFLPNELEILLDLVLRNALRTLLYVENQFSQYILHLFLVPGQLLGE